MRRIACTWVMLTVVLALAALSQAGEPTDSPAEGTVVAEKSAVSIGRGMAIGGACLAAAAAALGSGYAIARIGASCIESIARQPEAGGAMFAPMVVTAAMVEGGMLFAIVVCLLAILALRG